jgi:exodeoxyribonuclease V alpha subunit
VIAEHAALTGDPYDVRRARAAEGILRIFNVAGVLAAADVHVAAGLGRLGGEADEGVLLAAALAVRAPRLGHVCADLATAPASVAVDADRPLDPTALPWPDPAGWRARLAASPLVADGEDAEEDRPLRLVGWRLYLDRYWRDEREVAADLRARAGRVADDVDEAALAAGLDLLFDGEAPDLQRRAAEAAVRRRLAVIAGGPGTGKTTTVARLLALLDAQAAALGRPAPLVALAAPTGKAAARLEEAVHEEAVRLPVDDAGRERLLAARASTIHRLLGWLPSSRSRFRHGRRNRLPHDVVVVDETSMVSLSLMARLLEAVRTDARLVLLGDPEQLASVEAGAVLGDIVGPAAARDVPGEAGLGAGVVVLRRVHRFGGAIAALAAAVQRGDADAAVAALAAGGDGLEWVDADPAAPGSAPRLAGVRAAAVAAGRAMLEAARAGRGADALDALDAFRLLCAHRRGPHGVAAWSERVEAWLGGELPAAGAEGPWYAGRPLLVTENDHGLRLYNGDTGVVVARADGALRAVFDRPGGLLEVSPTRLAAVETVHAMTVHKAQGSQFDALAVLLPDPGSPILTRELLYTAVTRARRRLIVAGTEAAVRAAVGRPVARASGLRDRLWTAADAAGS